MTVLETIKNEIIGALTSNNDKRMKTGLWAGSLQGSKGSAGAYLCELLLDGETYLTEKLIVK